MLHWLNPWASHQTDLVDHSGRPAFRIPSAKMAKSFGRRNGVGGYFRLTEGSISSRRTSISCARSILPACALATTDARSATGRFGLS
jgi:hypothetical protein